MQKTRQAGILLHVSSLPSDYGIGTMGREAYKFVDWLSCAGIKLWQTLPLLPTGYGDSPYQACANNALNYYFIDLDTLRDEGLLEEDDYASLDWGQNKSRVDYGKLFINKANVLRKAFSRFNKALPDWQEFLKNAVYLDFAVFMTIKQKQNFSAWTDWEGAYKNYSNALFLRVLQEDRSEVEFWQFTQFLFLKQWRALKKYANAKGISIMGDMPIYVASDSVEMWKYRQELFVLDGFGNPALQAGVPPDAFSSDGQLWGNPVYNWPLLREKGYLWWKNRIDYNLELFDIVRIDHFRGFDRFFAIKIGEATAKNGEWMQGPGAELFEGREHYNIVAEDLGIIDQGVRDMLAKTGYPGMKVLVFALDGNPYNTHKPTYYTQNCVAYTGTHDNEPLLAHITSLDEDRLLAFKEDLRSQCASLGVDCLMETEEQACKTAIELLMASNAFACVIPMQDVLCMGAEARMNFPSTFSENNWSFRFSKGDFTARTAEWLKSLIIKYGR